MRVFLSTVVRGAPVEKAGELISLDWEKKQVRPVPDAEMRRIWKANGIPVELDESNLKRYWKQLEGGVKAYLIREYWTLDEKKEGWGADGKK